MILHLDTHILVWLYAGDPERFSLKARAAVEHAHLVYTPIAVDAEDIIAYLETRIGLARDEAAYSPVVKESCGISWTRDPFDRLIAGAALVSQHPLLTRDPEMRRNCHLAFWDHCDTSEN